MPEPNASERARETGSVTPAEDQPAQRSFGPVMRSVRELLSRLERELPARAARQAEIAQEFERARSVAQQAFDGATVESRAARDRVLSEAKATLDAELAAAERELGSKLTTTKRKLRASATALEERVAAKRRKIEQDAKEAVWLSETVAESDDRQSESRLEALGERIERQRERSERIKRSADATRDELLTPTFVVSDEHDVPQLDEALSRFAEVVKAEQAERAAARGREEDDNIDEFLGVDSKRPFSAENPDDLAMFAERQHADTERLIAAAEDLRSPKFARGSGFLLIAAGLVVVGAGVGFAADGFTPELGLVIGGATGAVIAAPTRLLLVRSADRGASRLAEEASRSLTRARLALDRCEQRGDERRERERAEVTARQQREAQAAQDKRTERLERLRTDSEQKRREIETPLRSAIKDLSSALDDRKNAAQRARDDAVKQATDRFERETTDAQAAYDAALADAEERRRAEQAELDERWATTARELSEQAADLRAERDELLRDWNDPEVLSPDHDDRVSHSSAIGALPVDLARFDETLPRQGAGAWPGSQRFELPATLEFPTIGSLLVEANGAGREAGLELIRGAMLRLIATLPAGKARFTIIDPVGLGQSFAAFMHLADADEQLVAGRIWTEPRHIEQRLLDLTEHMENVIQKYLRNEFATVEAYNERAGEIAEPYRFLVLADFPTNLSDVSARRLASIASSGARCGVHMLVLADPRGETPRGVTLDDLRGAALNVRIDDDGSVRIAEGVFDRHPLSPAAMPGPERMTALLKEAGRRSTDASRVQVPFAAVAPGRGEEWSRSSAKSLHVPLGRSGASRLQDLELGEGTLQHALIAGKTGSGKSTLMHVLITNASLWYSPDELELYLVDFKKGVEFKTYAGQGFPHARVVAIETDREFGLSVLRRVDEELARRGSLFRDINAQNLPGYREASGSAMPRVLLVIDEFQELFVEDDRIAQEAALLLDRLVRQGRAFGVHVVLGSQTLGGTYSLARTTMSQMNVRIALQCDEQDSYLILSEDNAAARLLARPGEAIYNDAGGKLEGNSPFQIVWLPEKARKEALDEIARLTESHHVEAPATIVFEGNVPAEAARNDELRRLSDASVTPDGPPRLFLGEPTAIEGPVNVPLLRRGGQNIIVIGQREDAADAMLAMAAASFALHNKHEPGAAVYALDGTPPELAESDALREVMERLPITSRFGGVRDAEALLVEVASELDRRSMLESISEPGLLVLVNGLHRFRDLRKSDDFSFSSSFSDPTDDDAPTPSEPLDRLFARIVEQGPDFGVHVMAWCDTVTNLERSIDRRMMKEFESRVLFQMGAMDSTSVIDSPAASRLGSNRAILASDEAGSIRTFRPYRRPDSDWLDRTLSSTQTT